MLDIKLIRENPELVKKGIEAKNEKGNIDQLLENGKKRRNIIFDGKALLNYNQVSEESDFDYYSIGRPSIRGAKVEFKPTSEEPVAYPNVVKNVDTEYYL